MKKVVKAFTATALVTSVIAPVQTLAAPTFTDVKITDHYAEAVTSLAERGIIKGYSDNTYRPGKSVTRGQAAKIIAGVLGLDTKNVTNAEFKDISTSDEFYGPITALANAGIINGYSDQTFRQWEPITRNQMAKIIARAFSLEAKDTTTPFTDLSTEYADYITALYANNITTGVTKTTFKGELQVTRGQLAAFVYRAENLPSQEEKQQVIGAISSITSDKVTIGEKTYAIPTSLQSLLNDRNKVALKDAKIEATVIGDALVELHALTITAEGTKENPIVLDGMKNSSSVASLTNIASNQFELGSILTVDAPYLEIKNMNVNEIVVTPKVKKLMLSEKIDKVLIEKNATANITGDATVKLIEIATENTISIDLKGAVEKLNISVSNAAIKLGTNTKIADILTNGVDVSKLISNYDSVRSNISSVNGAAPPPSGSNDSSSGNGSSTPPGSVTHQISGKIKEITANAVTINNVSYTVDQTVSGLLTSANADVLLNSDIQVTVKNNKIMKVTALTVNNAGTLSGGKTTINGNLTVNIDGLNVKDLTVTGDTHLTSAVISAINFSKVAIQGKFTTSEVTATTNTQDLKVASNAPLLADEKPVTRLKITFADSTVAFIEIKKVDTALSIHGATQISTLALQSNGSIYADQDVILPNVKIEDGVTKIELNASIASIEIESNDDIEITGKGNFDKVLVKTDKQVTLDTTGTIKQLGSDTGNITLGTDIKVGDTTSLNGETKSPDELISNIDEVRDNVNVEIDNDELEDYLAAKVIPVEGRYGYATLSVLNAEGATIKYRLVKSNRDNDLVEVGQKAPENTTVYNKGDQFIPWFSSDIQVYKVDENNTILDSYEIQNLNTPHLESTKMTVENNKIIYKSIFGRLPINTEFMFFVNGTQFFMPENLSTYEWYADADGIPTVEIPLPEDFSYNADEFTHAKIYLTVKENRSALSTINELGDYSKKDATYFETLYQIAQLSFDNNPAINNSIRNSTQYLLSNYAYEPEPVYDDQGNLLYTRHKSLVSTNNLVINRYLSKLKEKKYTTADEIKAMVIEVNQLSLPLIEQINEATKAVFDLFVEDFYKYEGTSKLSSSITQEKIDDAIALVQALPEAYSEKDYLFYLTEDARLLYAQFIGGSNVIIQGKEFLEVKKSDNNISINTNNLVFKEDATKIYINSDQVPFESIEQLTSVLSVDGYKVTVNDSEIIVDPADTTNPKTITLKNKDTTISTTTNGVVTIEIAKLKTPTQIEINEKTTIENIANFIEELIKRYPETTIKNLDPFITVSSPTLTVDDVFDATVAEFTDGGYVKEIKLTFSDTIQASDDLQFTFGGTVASSSYAGTTAVVENENTLKIYLHAQQIEMPTTISVLGLVDKYGKVILAEDIIIH